MARILCLHGMGCNSTVFKWQLGPLMKALGPHEYIFLDGEIACAPAPGMEGVAPAPHLCYYKIVSTVEIAAAHEQIHEFVEDEGPFDGVIGFSQGAALAASLLLHQAMNGAERPMFNFAIFFAGNLPFSPDLGLYREEIMMFLGEPEVEENPAGDLVESDGETPPAEIPGKLTEANGHHEPERSEAKAHHRSFYSLLLSGGPDFDVYMSSFVSDTDHGRAAAAALNEDLLSEHSCRPYHFACTETRIGIPTLHVIGKADTYYAQGRDLWRLCDNKESVLLEHVGGHDIPRDERTVREVVVAAERMIERGSMVAAGLIG
nr:hydrolase fub4 [Quercus suber]